MKLDHRWGGPLFAVLITASVFCAFYVNAPGAAVAGWGLAIVCAVVWLVVEMRVRRDRTSRTSRRL